MTFRCLACVCLAITTSSGPLPAETSFEDFLISHQAQPAPVDEAAALKRIESAPAELQPFLARDLQLRIEQEAIRERHDFLDTAEYHAELRLWREVNRLEQSEIADGIAAFLETVRPILTVKKSAIPPEALPEMREFLEASEALEETWRQRLETLAASGPEEILLERRQWRKEKAPDLAALQELALTAIEAENPER